MPPYVSLCSSEPLLDFLKKCRPVGYGHFHAQGKSCNGNGHSDGSHRLNEPAQYLQLEVNGQATCQCVVTYTQAWLLVVSPFDCVNLLRAVDSNWQVEQGEPIGTNRSKIFSRSHVLQSPHANETLLLLLTIIFTSHLPTSIC